MNRPLRVPLIVHRTLEDQGGIAGEENLNAAYDIRLVEEMEG